MKFHRVKVQNLNSLYGEQTIDFEEDVKGASLFLIVGPTGAGKSTILDAICLALFGQTPRLERRVGRADTDVAHIMSIGTAHAYAEVEFSTLGDDGERSRFLASWSARRAYDDPEGSVQRPERSLYRKFDDGTMRLVVSDHREKYFQPGFDDALQGLSVDDFKRSILLAQGEFSAFLHASDSEKASILERLTNTDDYRRIGERASRRRRAVEERHRALMMRLEEMQVLTIPQEVELAEALAKTSEAAEFAQIETTSAAKKVDWLQKLEDLEERLEKSEDAVLAAKSAEAERELDRARLARDAELAEAEPAWREVERATAVIAAAREKLEPAEQIVVSLSEAEAPLEARIESAGVQKAKCQEVLSLAEPQIRKAHDVRTRLEGATRQATEAAEKTLETQKAVKTLDGAIAQTTTRVEAAAKSVDTATARREALAASQPLLEHLGAIVSRFESGIRPLRARVASLEEERAKMTEERTQTAAERSTFDDQLAMARKDRGKWQGQVTKAQKRLTALLDDGATLAQVMTGLAGQLDSANARAEALREAKYLLQRIREQEREREEVRERLADASLEVARLAEDEVQLKELETTQRTLVRTCGDALRQTERVIALSSYRRDLDFGEPCPLCGSPVHPYCESSELAELDEDAVRDRERLDAELSEAREALRATNERVQRLANKFVARKTSLAKDESRALAITQALEEDQTAFSKSSEKAGYSPLEAFRLKNAEVLSADLVDAISTADSSRARLDEIEQARQQLDSAEQKLALSDARFTETTEVTEALDEKVATLTDRIATRANDISTAREDLAARDVALAAELEKLGVAADADASIEEVLQVATSRRDEVQKANEDYALAAHELQTARDELQRLTERRAEAQKATEATAAQLAGKREVVAKLEAEAVALFEGRDPEVVKAELDSAVKAAALALDSAKAARAAHAEKLSAARARQEELVKQIEGAARSLEVADEVFETTLRKLDIPRTEVEVHLLTTDERKRLATELGRLDKALTRATDRRDDLVERLRVHTELEVAGADETLSEATLALETARATLNEVTLELGALRERWTKHDQTKSRRSEIEEELQDVQHDLDVWTTLYGLIGVRDGERFKLFAQSLNLQGLVDNANDRLQKLHARYELAVARGDGGEPTLAFMVRDRYQANVERPLTTLSGGETFLVSLALALGLADFRRIQMPIETLLLDEGFGSLDQDSLHMALTTLHQLHRDGSRQIGIISHVDALKELIDARIVVEPRGHGRSELRFEFGAQTDVRQLNLVNA